MPQILIVTDDTDQAFPLLRYAFETYPDAEFTALDVIGPRKRPKEYLDSSRVARWLRKNREDSRERQASIAELGDEYGVSVSTEIAYGPAAEKVLERTESGTFDQAIIGRSHRSNVAQRTFGNVVDRMDRTVRTDGAVRSHRRKESDHIKRSALLSIPWMDQIRTAAEGHPACLSCSS